MDTLSDNTSTLNEYLQLGDNRNARVYTQILAEQVNRLAQDDVTVNDDDVTTVSATTAAENEYLGDVTVTSNSRETRAQIRHLILETLRDLPQRDEV